MKVMEDLQGPELRSLLLIGWHNREVICQTRNTVFDHISKHREES